MNSPKGKELLQFIHFMYLIQNYKSKTDIAAIDDDTEHWKAEFLISLG